MAHEGPLGMPRATGIGPLTKTREPDLRFYVDIVDGDLERFNARELREQIERETGLRVEDVWRGSRIEDPAEGEYVGIELNTRRFTSEQEDKIVNEVEAATGGTKVGYVYRIG